jgi:hypothetical protein
MTCPDLPRTRCPWCGLVIPQPTPARVQEDVAEYVCPACQLRHTRQQGVGAPLLFFPPDIEAALAGSAEPLDLPL